jgi:prepilin-type processing-associated H-X9-DG protein
MRRWVSVLVVALVLVLVVGLVVPGIYRVRQASARMHCSNNLKTLGIAVATHHETYGVHPAATIPHDVLPPERRLSWIVASHPFIEQGRLVLDRAKAWDSSENLEPKFASCDPEGPPPQDVGEWALLRCRLNPAMARPDSPGLTDFVGVAGVGTDAANRSLGYPGVGFFGYDRKTSMEDIKDGLATTMMVIETSWKNGPWTAGGFPTVRGLDPFGGPYLGVGGQFGSNHGTNALFADGSVRVLTDSVSREVFEALATIAGGEEVADW